MDMYAYPVVRCGAYSSQGLQNDIIAAASCLGQKIPTYIRAYISLRNIRGLTQPHMQLSRRLLQVLKEIKAGEMVIKRG